MHPFNLKVDPSVKSMEGERERENVIIRQLQKFAYQNLTYRQSLPIKLLRSSIEI